MQENYIDAFNAITEAYRLAKSEADALFTSIAQLHKQLKAAKSEPVKRVLQTAYDDALYAYDNILALISEFEKQAETL